MDFLYTYLAAVPWYHSSHSFRLVFSTDRQHPIDGTPGATENLLGQTHLRFQSFESLEDVKQLHFLLRPAPRLLNRVEVLVGIAIRKKAHYFCLGGDDEFANLRVSA